MMLDELSTDTLKSYRGLSSVDRTKLLTKKNKAQLELGNDYNTILRKLKNRSIGSNKASEKIKNEKLKTRNY